MTGGYPILGGGANLQEANVPVVNNTTLSANNTKTSWVEQISSTSYDAAALAVQILYGQGGSSSANCAVDIGIGSSGQEVVIAADLLCGGFLINTYTVWDFLLPISIPAGTRIAARAQVSANNGNNQSISPNLILLDGSFIQSQAGGVDTIGVSDATTKGTTLTTSGTVNTKGSYAQLTASSTADYYGFFLAFDDNPASAAADFYLDIAVGGGGSEKVILPNYLLTNGHTTGSGNHVCNKVTPHFPLAIPAGTRIAARVQCDVTAAHSIAVAFYGLKQ